MTKIGFPFLSRCLAICAIIFLNIVWIVPSAYAICACSCKGAGATEWNLQPGTLPGEPECAKKCNGTGGSGVQSKCDVPTDESLPGGSSTSTAGKCLTCFCQTSDGAVGVGSLTPSACLAACTKQNSPAVCAYTIDQYPDRNLQCFKKEQCEKPYAGKDAKLKGKNIGIFSDGEHGIPKFQPPECLKDSRYCFPNPQLATPLTLNVAIGSLTTAIDVAQYIQALYNWMIGAGVTIAIVLIMIGGLQYVLGAGGGSAAKTAKKRIADAIIGLILLLCVNLILKTVNPYLLSLRVPQLPMIRTIDLIRGQNDCATLAKKYILTDEKGKVITDPDSKKCGDKASVKETITDHTAVPAGSTCDFTTCPEGKGVCFAGKGKPQCMKCEEVVEGNDMKITPNSSICGQLSLKNGNSAGFPDIHQCGWTRDKDVNKGFFKTGSFGSCAMVDLNCNEIGSCGEYGEKGAVKNALGTDALNGITDENDFFCAAESLSGTGGGCGDFGIKSICKENPCSTKFGGKIGTECAYKEDEKKCQSTGVAVAAPPKDDTGCKDIKCDASSKCVSDGITEDGGPHFGCATCEQLTDGNKLGQDGKKIVPSTPVCSQFTKSKFDFCGWSKDSAVTNWLPGQGDTGACVSVKINCSEIKGCLQYGLVQANNGTIVGGKQMDFITSTEGDFNIKTICDDNPCGLPTGCAFSSGDGMCKNK